MRLKIKAFMVSPITPKYTILEELLEDGWGL
jgi:hypothetical protein